MLHTTGLVWLLCHSQVCFGSVCCYTVPGDNRSTACGFTTAEHTQGCSSGMQLACNEMVLNRMQNMTVSCMHSASKAVKEFM